MRLTRRLAAIVAAATLAGPLLTTSAAHAAGSYTCFSGDLTPAQGGGYTMSAYSCDGAGYADVLITLMFGPSPGTYRCNLAFSWNGFLSASGCREQ